MRVLVSFGTSINGRTLVKDLYGSFKPAKHGHLSPLAGAAMHGQIDAALVLISWGAHMNPYIHDSSSAPLHQACVANDFHMTRLLLEAGADVDYQNIYNTTAIMCAVRYGSLSLIQLLLSYSPDLSICFMVGINVVYWAMLPERDNSADIIAMLLQAGADADIRVADESTPLHYAAQSGLRDVVEVLLIFGADERSRDHDGRTPLDIALTAGSEMCVDLLDSKRRSRE
jgi:ankyrin repeat protein